jgi:hypothetical protein
MKLSQTINKIMIHIKKAISILLSVFLHAYGLFGQTRIVDSLTRKPLPYAIIVFPQANKGLYSDENGLFNIPREYGNNDSIRIQMSGYSALSTVAGNVGDTVFLKPVTFTLPETIVRPYTKIVETGFAKKKGKVSYSGILPVRFAVHVPNETNTACAVSHLLYRYKVCKGIKIRVRPSLYTAGENGPDSLIMNADITIISNEGILNINCDEGIVFPDKGLFVALEAIEAIDGNLPEMCLYILTSHRKPNSYASLSSYWGWHSPPGINGLFPDATFGLRLKCVK